MSEITVSTFYHFVPFQEVPLDELRQKVFLMAEMQGLKGLILLGTEGINGTVAGSPAGIHEFEQELGRQTSFSGISFKHSEVEKTPFSHLRVKLRREIVTQGTPELVPDEHTTTFNHLDAKSWRNMLSQEGVTVLDTRNTYETEIGHFEGAILPPIETFSEFPKYLASSQLPKDKTYLIYCTGGIRCEKAALEMKRQGFEEVYQLDGGILKYLQDAPAAQGWRGECFVFDYRVAVDQNLAPSQRYRLCPHCGQPADEVIDCRRCDVSAKVCKKCLERDPVVYRSCSKNCAYHLKLNPLARGKHSFLSRESSEHGQEPRGVEPK